MNMIQSLSGKPLTRSLFPARPVEREASVPLRGRLAGFWLGSESATLVLLVCLAVVAGGPRATGQVKVSPEGGSSSRIGSPVGGQHDMLLLLPSGPLHLRAHISDAKKPLKEVRQQYLSDLVASLDMDQDGQLSRDETAKHPLFASSRRFEGNAFLNSLRPRPRTYSENEIAMKVRRAAGRLVTYRQNDALADQDLRVFGVLDEDGSGLIDRVEMRFAAARIAQRDSDFDQCVTFNEFLDDAPDATSGLAVNPLDGEPPGSVHSDLLRDADEPTLAGRLVRRYDTDRDAHLTADELHWPQLRVEGLDDDGDGRLSMQELTRIAAAEPDVSLEIDLSEPTGQAMRLVGGRSPDVRDAQGDLVRLRRDRFSLSAAYRYRDPVDEAEQNAAAAFNLIDADANGYLDREEIDQHQRFERYLFDAMDRDEDDRLFAEEMMSYVRRYTQPASTTCQVTLWDTGNGLFQKLDDNADGRISIRELRGCEQRLLAIAGDQPQLNPSQMTKAYKIEFRRGGVSLFGRVDRPEVETPTATLAPRSGPVWFRRMDRNGDGDLTWNEFLGPRDVFEKLDRDRDDLIDPTEAEKAS